MNHSAIEQAARALAERRAEHRLGERLPQGLRAQDLQQGFAVQSRVAELLAEQRADRQLGWKCALPPAADKIVVAPLYARECYQGEARLAAKVVAPRGVARIEPELAFVMGSDLPADQAHHKAAVDAAIQQVHMAVELIGVRFDQPELCEFPEMLADGLFNQGTILGPVLARAQAFSAQTIAIALHYPGVTLNFEGKHANGLPTNPIYWLAEFLRDNNRSLRAGDIVITGSYAGVIEVPLNREITLNYAGLGEMNFCCQAR